MTTLRENTKQQGMLANSKGRRKKIKTSITADAGMNTKRRKTVGIMKPSQAEVGDVLTGFDLKTFATKTSQFGDLY
ncbi:hypothetical protein K457DRAFT_1875562 [Linnemannia elongata AG-77]|uniref:Uncharacterized protein n=1 Tax=Linnemannia elongata AG-77 TaxID=1314771 RepID=A0A197JXE4_9FUNG|nr:hypothetical protein K457DRAFT_1875562 [Linnemannia elongata AG-77]